MRVVVCGSRSWTDRRMILDRLTSLPRRSEVITGGARGADQMADYAADLCGHLRIIYPACWTAQGRAAGALRNRRMLDTKPNLVIAFRADGDSRGTDDMIAEARRQGFEVEVWGPHGQVDAPDAL